MFLTFFIFLLIFFLYFHIMDQYKKSEDLEIYETDYHSNTELQKACSIRQPILFDFISICPEVYEELHSDRIRNAISHTEVTVKDTDDYWIPNQKSVDSVTLSYASFDHLAKTDTNAHFFTENNSDIINDTAEIYKEIQRVDPFLKPHFVVQTKYDILSGSNNCTTPFRYHTNERAFYTVVSGSITVQLTPWRSRKLLEEKRDYNNYEFWSPVKPKTIDAIPILTCIVPVGKILYIPPHWWHSFQFSKDTILFSINYNSLANIASNIPAICRYYLQFHNTNKKILPTISPSSNETDEEIDKLEESNKKINE